MSENRNLEGTRVAILATDGFEQVELLDPRDDLDGAGARTEVIAPESGSIRGWDKTDWGKDVDVDRTINSVSVDDFDALVLPGGVLNPDQLRMNEDAVRFVRDFVASGKPVAAICHGPQMLIEARVVEGKRITSYPAIRRDLINAGAEWVDEEVCIDGNLITSRKPDDIPAFNRAMIENFRRAPETV
jgi:protease I